MSLDILMITDNDPAGMAIAFTNAINRYTPHNSRLITTQVKYVMEYGCDIHLPGIVDEDYGEIESLLRNADVIHFHVLFDEHRMLGPIPVREYIAGKKVIYHHHGHPDFLLNAERYRERYTADDSTVLVSTPDLTRQLPESTWLPNLVPITDPLFLPRADDLLTRDEMIVAQAPTRRWHKHTREFCDVGRRLTERHPNARFELIEGVSYAECLRWKRRCSIVFDHMNGHFGISSLESLSQGVPVVAGLDEHNVRLMRDFTGSELPWVIARTEAELEEQLEALIVDPERRVEVGRESRAFMERCWSEQHVMDVLLPFYER